MAAHNQILYIVWSETEQKSYGEFLNKDCAIKFMATMIIRLAGKEYGAFIQSSVDQLDESDYYHYGKLHIEDYYINNFTLKRKIWDDKSCGFIACDPDYDFDITDVIDRSKLVEVLVNTAKSVIGKPINK